MVMIAVCGVRVAVGTSGVPGKLCARGNETNCICLARKLKPKAMGKFEQCRSVCPIDGQIAVNVTQVMVFSKRLGTGAGQRIQPKHM